MFAIEILAGGYKKRFEAPTLEECVRLYGEACPPLVVTVGADAPPEELDRLRTLLEAETPGRRFVVMPHGVKIGPPASATFDPATHPRDGFKFAAYPPVPIGLGPNTKVVVTEGTAYVPVDELKRREAESVRATTPTHVVGG